ncbi:MAG TPA: hypothetical protein VIG08_11870 [Gemmatimonadales bacterium]|jgi:hypothetical protein
MNEDQLRAVYGAALERGRASAGGQHASPEAIAALARREGPESERLATLDHVMSCKDCRAEFDLLRAVEVAGAQAGATRSVMRRSWFVPAALAASLLLAVGVGRMVVSSRQDDLTRGEARGALTLIRPAAEAVAGDSLTFGWHAAPGARSYALEVLDSGGSVVASATTPDTLATPGAIAALPPGDYTWWVRATTTDARTLSSAIRPLRLKPR